MISKEQVKEFLTNVSEFQPARLDGIHPRVLNELDEVISKAWAIIFANSRTIEEAQEH